MHRLLDFVKSYKTIAKNTMFLSIIECVHLIMPFLALPYILQTVGTENYGKIIFAQAIIVFFSTFIDFGVNIPAVKLVSRNRNSRMKLQLIVGSVISLKIATFVIALLFFSAMVLLIPKYRCEWAVFFAAFLSCLGNVIFCHWFFQGIEKMLAITIVRVSSMMLYLVALFTFVRTKEQYALIPLWQSLALILTSLGAFLYMCFREKVIPIPRKKMFVKRFKEAIPFFLSRCSAVLNHYSGTVVVGAVLGNHSVAVYDLAKKIVNAALIPYSMLTQSVYPHNAQKRDARFATQALLLAVGICCVGLLALYFISPYLIDFLSKGKLADAVPLLRFLEIHILLCSFTYYLGTPMLVAWGYSKPFNDSVIVSTAFLLITYALLYSFSINSVYVFASVCISAEVIVLVYRGYYCFKHRIIRL